MEVGGLETGEVEGWFRRSWRRRKRLAFLRWAFVCEGSDEVDAAKIVIGVVGMATWGGESELRELLKPGVGSSGEASAGGALDPCAAPSTPSKRA